MAQVVNHPARKLEELLDSFLSAPDKDILLECTAYAVQHALDPQRLEKIVDQLINNKATLGLSVDDILEKLEHVDLAKAIEKAEEKQEKEYEERGEGLTKEEFIAAWKASIPERSNELQYFIAGDQLLPLLPPSISQVARRVFGRIDRYLRAFISESPKSKCDRLNALFFRFHFTEEYLDIVSGLVALAIYEELHQTSEVLHPIWLCELFSFSEESVKYKNKETAINVSNTDILNLLDQLSPHEEFILSRWFNGLTTCAFSFHEVFSKENKAILLNRITNLVDDRGYRYLDKSWFVEDLLTFAYVALNESVIDDNEAQELAEWIIDTIKETIASSLETGCAIPWGPSTISHINETVSMLMDMDVDEAWLLPFFLGTMYSEGTALSVFYSDGSSIKHYAYVINELLEYGWQGFAEAMMFSMLLHLPYDASYFQNQKITFEVGSWEHIQRIVSHLSNTTSPELTSAIQFCVDTMRKSNWFEELKTQPQYLELRYFLESTAERMETKPAPVFTLIHRHRDQTPEQLLATYLNPGERARLSQASRDTLMVALEETMNFFSGLLKIIEDKRPDDSFKPIMSFGRFLEISLREVMTDVYDQIKRKNIRSFLLEDGKSGLTLYAMLGYIRRYPRLSTQEKSILDETGLTLQKDLRLTTLLDDIVRRIRNKAAHDDKYSWKDTAKCIEILLGEEQVLKRFIRCLPER